ncbi:hypothetical protein JAO76_09740 [Pontibacter sp. BT310]|jgi:hypothetical protein|uniref:STAS/SEC14 domain-containing protein n=1 Tax=Pontibacter populi TaxID=890055 RepID=A0ABS6XBN7_9BACT|nr:MULTISPECIES: hypothetical protein [Pontibacter]MBJ6118473.1 hypothetical protein [Pontibacter sp. BT310]MBR0570902.1 hypothetical protein [Microvirga sp. STS03]MBW3365327.1 hypothetical protein [Pontibacter populi]
MVLQHASISETITTDQSGFTIRYSEPLSLVEVTLNDQVSLNELQPQLSYLLEVIEDKQPLYLLADTRKFSLLGNEGQKVIRNNFLLPLTTSSVIKFARITEPDVFTQAVIDSLLSKVKCESVFGCSMQSFTDRETALDWIYSS